jgi:hypothetical protein
VSAGGSAANDDDILISTARLAVARMNQKLDGVRKLKSGLPAHLLRDNDGVTSDMFGHQLRGLLRDFHRQASELRRELLGAQSRESLGDSRQLAVSELLQVLAQIEAECAPAVRP